jgi:hypothetical protein
MDWPSVLTFVFWLIVCIAYDGFALLLAVRGGKHPAPFVYLYVVPSAEMLTGFVLMGLRGALPIDTFVWFAMLAAVLEFVALGTVLIALGRYRRSPTI